MGYTTDFWGEVTISPPLNEDEAAFLRKFNETRRMNRAKGPYFVGGTGMLGQGSDSDIISYNDPPAGQPGLWCQWVPTDGGDGLEWDGSEKFYHATDWMKYIIDHFLKPGADASHSHDPQFANFTFNHTVNGVIDAQGEDPDDRWQLHVVENYVTTKQAVISFE